jgi:hypothetical protein
MEGEMEGGMGYVYMGGWKEAWKDGGWVDGRMESWVHVGMEDQWMGGWSKGWRAGWVHER